MKNQRKPRRNNNDSFTLVSRASIHNLLAQAGLPLKLEAIAAHFQHTGNSELQALTGRLQAMVRDGELVVNRRLAYGLPKSMDLVRGVVSNTERNGFGTLLADDGGEYLLSRNQMRHLLVSDIIIARLGPLDKNTSERFAALVEFVKRPSFVGRVRMVEHAVFVRPLKRHVADIWLKQPLPDLRADELVQVQIEPQDHDPPRGSVVNRFQKRGNAYTEARIALANNSIDYDFDEATIAEAGKIKATISAAESKRRVDLSHLPLCTIDGSDARDYDDAVYADKQGKNYKLIVAIADVSHYVKEHSHLDRSAQARGTSVYFPDLVAPMLPERLSNDLCSLLPERERLALVVELELNHSAEIINWRFFDAIIRSQARLQYTQAQTMLDDASAPDSPVSSSLRVLAELYAKRAKLRQKRGALEIDTYSAEFELDEQGSVKSVYASRRLLAHKLIEEMMLLANEAAATCLHQYQLAGLYRIHEPPSPQSIESLVQFLRTRQIKLSPGKLNDPRDYARLAKRLANKPMAELLQLALLRSLSQARYSPSPGLHFGLNYQFYTHFTSPIRRYPDLVVHRQIKAALRRNGGELSSAGQASSQKISKTSAAKMTQLARQQSFLERRAESASREATDVLKCHYLTKQLGAVFTGSITHITSFGLFISVLDLPIEGMVHVSALSNDYYRYDPQSQSLRASRSRKLYSIGMLVKAQLVRVDLDKRRVELALVE